jgi:hypothetical protein
VKRERRQPTRRELASITSRWPVVRKIPPPNKADCPGPNVPGNPDRHRGYPARGGD